MSYRIAVFLTTILLWCGATVHGQTSASEQLNQLGEELVDAIRANDSEEIAEHFFTREEVWKIMTEVNEANGGVGVLEYEVDSIYRVFGNELTSDYNLLQAELKDLKIKSKRLRFVEVGLDRPEKMGEMSMADLILIVRFKKDYFMVRFPQCFSVNDGWKIGAVIEWVGQVTK